MKVTIKDCYIDHKRVLLRVDYNVPLKNNAILDDTKIKLTLDTIHYLLEHDCKIIILSHLGKIKNEKDKALYSLQGVANRLRKLLDQEVYFSKVNYGEDLLKRVMMLKDKEILLLENTRFLDVPNKLESNCNEELSKYWASLGEVFVNDAFASSHRRHSSTYGISKYLPSCIGLLMEKEITSLNQYIMNPTHPFTVIMGGAKIDDKMSLLKALLPKCDYLLCGGGIANTCLKALSFETGESIASTDETIIEEVKKLLFTYQHKIMLPLDAIVGSTYDPSYIQYKLINIVNSNDMILDIGIKTLEKYQKVINDSKTIFLNGTVGMYENKAFANGTKELLRMLSEAKAIKVVGGGDASSSVYNLGFEKGFTYISSGGGATLEYIATGKLVALDLIKEKSDQIETLTM